MLVLAGDQRKDLVHLGGGKQAPAGQTRGFWEDVLSWLLLVRVSSSPNIMRCCGVRTRLTGYGRMVARPFLVNPQDSESVTQGQANIEESSPSLALAHDLKSTFQNCCRGRL